MQSFLEHTPNGIVVVVDDGHPRFHKFWDDRWNVLAHSFPDRAGVTRSWNFGLACARLLGAKYTICSNDDVLFTQGWSAGPARLLENDSVGLVGPLSNAPGLSNAEQNIWDHALDYRPSDSPMQLAYVAAQLRRLYRPAAHVAVPAVNGFFMIGRTERWWEGRHDNDHVFHRARRFAMVHSEHELQNRFHARGWCSLVSLRTFIFPRACGYADAGPENEAFIVKRI